MYRALVYNVLIASPGDVALQREEVERSLQQWNRDHAEHQNRVLMPLRWEYAIPESGRGDGQQVLNRQLVDKSDIVLALFSTRIGTATGRSISGTVEEIDNALADGKPVHVYFDTSAVTVDLRSIPDDYQEQLAALDQFKASMRVRTKKHSGLYQEFSGQGALGRMVESALTSDMRWFAHVDNRINAGEDGAVELSVHLAPGPTGDARLIVSNVGRVDATNVRFKFIGDAAKIPRFVDTHGPLRISVGATVALDLGNTTAGDSTQLRTSWTENHKAHVQTLTLTTP